MNARANTIQHGGDHYQTAFQHWDMIERYGIGYLEAAATKYISRWAKKGTPQLDLEKAQHYTQKLIELHLEIHRLPRGFVPDQILNVYAEANGLGPLETIAVRALCQWVVIGDLHCALKAINDMLTGLAAGEVEVGG